MFRDENWIKYDMKENQITYSMFKSFLDNKNIVFSENKEIALVDYIYYDCKNLYTTLKEDTIILYPYFIPFYSIDYYFSYNKTTDNVESVSFQPRLFNNADAAKFKYLA